MTENKDIAVLAKKVYELSVLPVEALDARKWEALLILNAVYSSATPEGIDKANADKATETVAGNIAETAGQVAEGANNAAKGVATLLKWAPYVLAGIGAIGATAVVLAATNRASQPAPAA